MLSKGKCTHTISLKFRIKNNTWFVSKIIIIKELCFNKGWEDYFPPLFLSSSTSLLFKKLKKKSCISVYKTNNKIIIIMIKNASHIRLNVRLMSGKDFAYAA